MVIISLLYPFPAGNYLFKVSNGNNRRMSDFFSKLTMKTPGRSYWYRYGVFIVNYEQISHIPLVSLLLILKICQLGRSYHKKYKKSTYFYFQSMAIRHSDYSKLSRSDVTSTGNNQVISQAKQQFKVIEVLGRNMGHSFKHSIIHYREYMTLCMTLQCYIWIHTIKYFTFWEKQLTQIINLGKILITNHHLAWFKYIIISTITDGQCVCYEYSSYKIPL